MSNVDEQQLSKKSNWLLFDLQKYKRSKIAKSATIAGSVFATSFLIIQAIGITGSIIIFVYLS